jgi:FAD/FMN-containing dehydrogenase
MISSTTLANIRSRFTGEIYNDAATLTRYSRDASLFTVPPNLVVYPRHVRDIQELVRYVAAHPKEKLSLTVRSGGTDMTGGPLNESIIVDTNSYLNHLKSVDDSKAVTEPGVYYRDFEAATLKRNRLLPSYPASKEICTVGGMVANNSGGEKTLTYGQTKEFVTQLKIVLQDGEEHTFERLSAQELEQKMKLTTWQGELYRQVFALVKDNDDILQRAKPNTTKNSTGYQLWDVWDKKTGAFDMTRIFTGSQGTLGIITEITFRLVEPRPFSQLLVIFVSDTKLLSELIPTVLRYNPESFESYDDHTLKFALRYLPDIIKRLHFKSTMNMMWQFLPEMRMLLTSGLPKMVLLAEFTGYNAQEVEGRLAAAKLALEKFNLNVRHITQPTEKEKYWVIRRESFNLLRHHVHGKRTAPFIDDIVVAPAFLPRFLPELDTLLSRYNLLYTIAGHIGDGNFHIIPLMDLTRPQNRAVIPKLSSEVYDLVLKYKGSISGEHNDGLIRSHYLKKMYGDEVYALFEKVKKIFDPHNIFNPGKKIDASWEKAAKFLV